MPHQFNIFPRKRLVAAVFEGDVSAEDMLEIRKQIIRHHDYEDDLRGVFDFRKARKIYHWDELEALSSDAKKNSPCRGKWCSINSTPKETAYSELFKLQITSTHPFENFSTVKAASQFLNTDLSEYLDKKSPSLITSIPFTSQQRSK